MSGGFWDRGKRTFWDLVTSSAAEHPDRPVLRDDHGRELTCRGLRDRAEEFAAVLHAGGVRPDTVVTWQLPSTLETMVVMTALARLGAVQNPVIPILREGDLRFITRQVGTDLILVPETWRGFAHGDLARKLADENDFRVLVVDHDTDAAGVWGGLRLPAGDPARLPAPPADGEECRWIYFSSGTTADPKGVRHSDVSVMAGASGVVGMVGATSEDVNPLAFPISHIGGIAMLTAALVTGMQLVLFEAFDPVTGPAAIAAHRPTFLGSATPFFFAFMAAQRAAGPTPLYPDLRGCLGGGAPITPELGTAIRATFGVNGVANAWGLTEFPVATSPAPDAPAAVLDHTVGPPVPGVRVRVVGDEGELPPGHEGELRLKGPQCFLGYVDPALDADVFDADGWFRTGDLGLVDRDGNVRVTGRIKDAIIRNAENISANEVELVLARHPSVLDVAVIGVPDPRTGERLCAVLVLAGGANGVDVESLGKHCTAEGLARFKHPERVEIVEALPRNPSGKVLKQELRRRYP